MAAIPQVPPFVRVADALSWALERIARAGLEQGPYFREADAALERDRRGNVFAVFDLPADKHGRTWHVLRRSLFEPAGGGRAWCETGQVFTDQTAFPQAKAAELAAVSEMLLREDLERWLTRTVVETMEALGRDPWRELVLERDRPLSPAAVYSVAVPRDDAAGTLLPTMPDWELSMLRLAASSPRSERGE